MSKRLIGTILLLAGSLVIGWYAGRWGYSLFERTVPAAAITDLVRTGTRATYVGSGMLLGLIIFGWSMLASWSGRWFFGGESPAPPRPSAPPNGGGSAPR